MRAGSDQDIANLMGLSLSRAQIRFQQGLPMPPATRVPGLRSRRFDMDMAEKWLRDHLSGEPRDIQITTVVPKRGRGRPHKTQSKLTNGTTGAL